MPLSTSIYFPLLPLLPTIILYSSSPPPSCLVSQSLVSPLPCLPPYLSSPPYPPSDTTVALFVAAVPPPHSPLSPPDAIQIFSTGAGRICIGGRTFRGLGLKSHPDGHLVRNIFEDSCTEEKTGPGKDIFEGGLKFAASKASKKFNSTD